MNGKKNKIHHRDTEIQRTTENSLFFSAPPPQRNKNRDLKRIKEMILSQKREHKEGQFTTNKKTKQTK
jgi:hypothetical protein